MKITFLILRDVKIKYAAIYNAIKVGKILSAHTVAHGGIAAAISKMTLGNEIGFKSTDNLILSSTEWFSPSYGDIIIEIQEDMDE